MVLLVQGIKVTECRRKRQRWDRIGALICNDKDKKQIYIFLPQLSCSFRYNGNELTLSLHKTLMMRLSVKQASGHAMESITVNVITLQLKNTINVAHQYISTAHTVHLKAFKHQTQSGGFTQSLLTIHHLHVTTCSSFPKAPPLITPPPLLPSSGLSKAAEHSCHRAW